MKIRIAVDFDGTCVDHDYPRMGESVPGATAVLQELGRNPDVGLICWTMRFGETLEAAGRWFKDREIPLLGLNDNPEQKSWTDSRKVYAHIYIDDAALGCPLITVPGFNRPCVDWVKVRRMLVRAGVLPKAKRKRKV